MFAFASLTDLVTPILVSSSSMLLNWFSTNSCCWAVFTMSLISRHVCFWRWLGWSRWGGCVHWFSNFCIKVDTVVTRIEVNVIFTSGHGLISIGKKYGRTISCTSGQICKMRTKLHIWPYLLLSQNLEKKNEDYCSRLLRPVIPTSAGGNMGDATLFEMVDWDGWCAAS